jgi:galactokinase
MTDSLHATSADPALVRRVREGFTERWGVPAELLAIAPGRVNLIGEHVDYNGGWVLPAAIDRHIVIAARRRTDGRVRLADAYFADAAEFSVDELAPCPGDDWGRYAKGVLAGLTAAGFPTRGFDAFLGSNLPVGGGLSSSAALEAAFGLIALHFAGGAMDRFALAKLCQKAEHVYAGVPCGIMDQAAVLNCRRDHLLFLDCEEESFTQVPFELPDWVLMVIDSGVSHDLASSEYGSRRAACHEAAAILGRSSLRGLSGEDLSAALETPGLTEAMRRCVRHVVTEFARAHDTVAALRAGGAREAGRLLNAGHASLRDDYRVSCAELDFIAATAQDLEGVAGCRMTGGGFGGCCIALVRKDAVETVRDRLTSAYREAWSRSPGIFVTRPGDGASLHLLTAEEARVG